MTHTLRVGSVPYLVGRPMDLGLEAAPGISLEYAVPAVLIERLRRGELDVALVSSIELFRRPGYRFLNGIGVAGRGVVSSVQLFLRKAIQEVNSIALDPSSRTARTLTRVLLSQDPAPEFVEVASGEDPRALDCDAWLRIGDPALRECHAEGVPSWNPSENWTTETGLPFVFAPWIVAPGVDMTPYLSAFREAHRRGQAAATTLADEAARAWKLPVSVCQHYLLKECLYELDSVEMSNALLAFRDRAAGLDLCDGGIHPAGIPL